MITKKRAVEPGLLIHLGNKKTGSTSLQGFLTKNEAILRGEKRASFIKAGRRHISHNRLYRPLCSQDAKDVWEQVAEEVSNSPEMLHFISSEMFFDKRIARSMADHMPDSLRRKVRLVVYLRRQDLFLEAMYKQLTKNGRIHATPSQFVELAREELGDYRGVLSVFEEVAGPDAISVRAFERPRMRNGDTTADFLNIMGLSLDDETFVQPAHPANETLSLAASQLLGAFARNSKLNAREIAREMLRGDDAPPRRSGDVFQKSQRQQIMERFASDNAEIAKRYLVDDVKTLFTLDDLALDAPDNYPSAQEEVQLFSAAQEKAAAAIGRIDARERSKLFRG